MAAVKTTRTTRLVYLFVCLSFLFCVLYSFDGVAADEAVVLSEVLGDGVDVLSVGAPPAVQALEQHQKNLIQILRFDKERKVSLDGVSSLKELVQLARDVFDDPRISRFVTRTGDPIDSLEALQKLPKIPQTGSEDPLISIIAMKQGDKFMWSAWKVGEEIPIQLDGRNVIVRTLATHPRLFEIENFIDLKECDHVINQAVKLGLVPSRVGDSAELAVPDPSRTSSQLWVGPGQGNDDAVFARIRNRVLNLTKLTADVAEDTQVVYYDLNQHYYAHHDFTRKEFVQGNPYYEQGGNRLVTVIYYINDVEEGGETGFPYVNSHTNPMLGIEDYSKTCMYGLNIKPKKGGAAMFYSLEEDGHMDGRTDPWSLHSGCDVLKGEKWIANQWIRNKRVNGKLYDAHY